MKTCPECGAEGVRRVVAIFLSVPLEMSEPTKADIATAQVKYLGVDWTKRGLLCPSCSWVQGHSVPPKGMQQTFDV